MIVNKERLMKCDRKTCFLIMKLSNKIINNAVK